MYSHCQEYSKPPIMTLMKTCDVQSCDKRHDSHGYCANHARQFRKYGHPLSRAEVSESRRQCRLKGSGNLGTNWSPEQKRAQSERLKGRTLNTGRTHFEAGMTPWNLGKPLSKSTKTKISEALRGRAAWNKGLEVSAIQGEANHMWAGDKVTYSPLHKWVSRHLGTPGTCVNCHTSGLSGRKIHWANKSREYKRDLTDWLRLCVKCHKAYDTGKLEVAV